MCSQYFLWELAFFHIVNEVNILLNFILGIYIYIFVLVKYNAKITISI
jgi:hypothetical protein